MGAKASIKLFILQHLCGSSLPYSCNKKNANSCTSIAKELTPFPFLGIFHFMEKEPNIIDLA
jgi:hypothetical protein